MAESTCKRVFRESVGKKYTFSATVLASSWIQTPRRFVRSDLNPSRPPWTVTGEGLTFHQELLKNIASPTFL